MSKATFFISTGRCGTQWIYKTLKDLLGKNTIVKHELLVDDYKSRYFFEHFHLGTEPVVPEAVSEHLDWIKNLLSNNKDYIEVGWPCYGLIPYYIDQLGKDNVRLVHLVRNPVDCVLSLDSHSYYDGRERMEKRLLYPTTEGVENPTALKDWDSYSHIEKCLFFWTEINKFGITLKHKYPDIEYYTIHFEDIFDGVNNLGNLIDTLPWLNNGLKESDAYAVMEDANKKFDNYIRKKKDKSIIKSQIERIPETSRKVMQELGYDKVQL